MHQTLPNCDDMHIESFVNDRTPRVPPMTTSYLQDIKTQPTNAQPQVNSRETPWTRTATSQMHQTHPELCDSKVPVDMHIEVTPNDKIWTPWLLQNKTTNA